jgi:hypothetical protein
MIIIEIHLQFGQIKYIVSFDFTVFNNIVILGWLGRITIVLSYITIVLGMRLALLAIEVEYAFISAVIIFLALHAFVEVYRWRYNLIPKEHNSQPLLKT